MQISLRTLSYIAGLTLLTSSAMAVLPTIALDTAAPAQVQTSSLTIAPSNAMLMMPMMPTTADNSQLQKRLLASVVGRDASGNEVLSPITAQTRLQSGNIIEYHGYVINRSPERVRSVKATFDLPNNTQLTSLSDMSPSHAFGSIDGINFQYMPLKSNVGGVLQDIPMSAYKAVRWDIQGLGLNEVAEVKFRVRVK